MILIYNFFHNKCTDSSESHWQHKLLSWNFLLIFTTLWANPADDKTDDIFLIFPRKQDLTFHANCLKMPSLPNAENFTQCAKCLFYGKYNYQNNRLRKTVWNKSEAHVIFATSTVSEVRTFKGALTKTADHIQIYTESFIFRENDGWTDTWTTIMIP